MSAVSPIPVWHNYVEPVPSTHSQSWMPIVSAISAILGLGGLAAFGVGFIINSMALVAVGGLVGNLSLPLGALLYCRYKQLSALRESAFNQEILREEESFVSLHSYGLPREGHEIREDTYFDHEKWQTHFGMSVPQETIPAALLEYLNTPCPFAPSKLVKETHMVFYIPAGVGNMRDFAGIPHSPNPTLRSSDYIRSLDARNASNRLRFSHALNSWNSEPLTRSYWLLMTRNPIPLSESMAYPQQQALLPNGYELPHALEAAICITGNYLSSGSLLFPDYRRGHGSNPRTMATRCVDSFSSDHICVGATSADGIQVYVDQDDTIGPGIAPVRRFYSN